MEDDEVKKYLYSRIDCNYKESFRLCSCLFSQTIKYI